MSEEKGYVYASIRLRDLAPALGLDRTKYRVRHVWFDLASRALQVGIEGPGLPQSEEGVMAPRASVVYEIEAADYDGVRWRFVRIDVENAQ